MKIIELRASVTASNDRDADALRAEMRAAGVLLVNLMSAPGSGKTTLIARLIGDLPDLRLAVMEADIESAVDAERIAAQTTPAPEGTVEARIETFIKGLLEHMGSDAVPTAVKVADDTYAVDLIGEHLGMLIGRRGDTLDAIQHITNYAVNHGQNKRVRINVDAENYRKKREESLERLATKVAGKVTKTRRNITLEPMNAYERHVIHAALQDYPDVTTYSTGTEPGRRVVVAYSRYRSTEE